MQACIIERDGSAIFGPGSFYTADTNFQITGDATSAKLTLNSPTNVTYSISSNKTDGSNGDFVLCNESQARNELVINSVGDIAIGDSGVTFNILGDAIALLPASITEQFETVINSLPVAQPFTGDPTTLPADTPTPLKEALVRVTTAGKINLNSNGSATFAGDVNVNASLVSTGSISTDETIYTKKWFQVDRTGAGETIFFGRLNSTPTVTITADGSATFAGDVVVGDNSNVCTVRKLRFCLSKINCRLKFCSLE